jgi:hypothetical protein
MKLYGTCPPTADDRMGIETKRGASVSWNLHIIPSVTPAPSAGPIVLRGSRLFDGYVKFFR